MKPSTAPEARLAAGGSCWTTGVGRPSFFWWLRARVDCEQHSKRSFFLAPSCLCLDDFKLKPLATPDARNGRPLRHNVMADTIETPQSGPTLRPASKSGTSARHHSHPWDSYEEDTYTLEIASRQACTASRLERRRLYGGYPDRTFISASRKIITGYNRRNIHTKYIQCTPQQNLMYHPERDLDAKGQDDFSCFLWDLTSQHYSIACGE